MIYPNILKKSQELIDKYDINSFPIEIHIIEQIIYDLGYKLINFEKGLNSCVINDLVILGKKEDEIERRKSLSHELFHIIYHATNQTNNEAIKNNIEEAEAEAFVLYFLIPSEYLKEMLDEEASIYEIATSFGVRNYDVIKRVKFYRKNAK